MVLTGMLKNDFPMERNLRPIWAKIHQIARQYNTSSSSKNLSKADFSFAINLAREAEFKFYWQMPRRATEEDADELLRTTLMLWIFLRTKEASIPEGKRKVEFDKPIPAREAVDVFRAEVFRQVELGIEIVRQVLETKGLFSEDPQYPGVTREWLEQLAKILGTERDKLEANEATIAVIGTMKAGKSTVINALVGSEVVPSRDQPMTTFPTRVVHVPGKLVPELTFPLSKGFDLLVRAIKERDAAASKQGENLSESMRSQAAANDLTDLLAEIRLGKVSFPRSAKGHDEIQAVLSRTNDLTRLAASLGVDPSVATPERLSFNDIPSIEIEFEHLAMLKSRAGGRFSMVDTPGPNEAGKNERLRDIVRLQLAEASGIILVLNYNELGSSATDDLVATLREIPPAQVEQLTVLTNRFDQRGANSSSVERVTAFACEQVRSAVWGSGAEQAATAAITIDGLAKRVYPTSARGALRACQARRALRMSLPIDPDADGWATEFANAAFGTYWTLEPEILRDEAKLPRAVEKVWKDSGFAQALEQTLVSSAANASLILMLGALGKLHARTEPLLEMLNVRDSAFLRSIEELRLLTDGLQSDLRNLDACLDEAQSALDKIEAEIGPEIRGEVATMIASLRSSFDKFLKTGKMKVEEREVSFLQRISNIWSKLGRTQTQATFSARFEGYQSNAPDEYWPVRALGNLEKIQCGSKQESIQLADRITAEIDALFRHFINNGCKIIDRATELFIERAQYDVASLFGKEWQSVQDRLQEILGLAISAPRPLTNLVDEEVGIGGGSYTTHRSWTETSWENVEGGFLDRVGARIAKWWDGKERDWGRRETSIAHREDHVDIALIRDKSLETAELLSERMHSYLQDVLTQLRLQTERYAEDVQMRVKSINTYILEEIRQGADQSDLNMQRRKITTMLAAQARDLIAEAVAIRAVVQGRQNG